MTPLKDLVGQSVDHFELQEVIAKGTTGLVFRAHDAEHDWPVAMKTLDPEFAGDEENMQRFVRAMKTMMSFRQENIVSICAAGKNDPFCWIAMEYVDGEKLEDVVDRISSEVYSTRRNSDFRALFLDRNDALSSRGVTNCGPPVRKQRRRA